METLDAYLRLQIVVPVFKIKNWRCPNLRNVQMLFKPHLGTVSERIKTIVIQV